MVTASDSESASGESPARPGFDTDALAAKQRRLRLIVTRTDGDTGAAQRLERRRRVTVTVDVDSMNKHAGTPLTTVTGPRPGGHVSRYSCVFVCVFVRACIRVPVRACMTYNCDVIMVACALTRARTRTNTVWRGPETRIIRGSGLRIPSSRPRPHRTVGRCALSETRSAPRPGLALDLFCPSRGPVYRPTMLLVLARVARRSRNSR
jgi:hypothetical protein